MTILKLGTRRSALALAQSGQMKAALEAAHPGLGVELVGIDTEGDEVHQNRFSTEPLHTLDGKNFFVKELDEALLSGRTDFSVHSYKDLSLERPAGLMIAAVPPRANPRDILLCLPQIREKIARGESVTIGSSSPRRAENTPRFLSALWGVEVRMQPLRGNVNTRMRKLQEGQHDGILLALAGLIRLGHPVRHKMPAQDLDPALRKDRPQDDVLFMILPLDACPTAPAQGALAIECRADDARTKALLSKLHHPATAAQIAVERALLKQHGGGCHQAFGATAVAGDILFLRGKSDAGQPLNEIQFPKPNYTGKIIPWDGSNYRSNNTSTLPLTTGHRPLTTVFVVHHRAVTPELLPLLKKVRIWTSGVVSMTKLSQMGLWVEGCAENLGFASIQAMLKEPVLDLPPLKDWTILTHADAVADWPEGNVIATYKIVEPEDVPEGLAEATHIWWGSFSQYQRLGTHARSALHHACGAGKTAERLRASGLSPDLFPTVTAWRKCVNT